MPRKWARHSRPGKATLASPPGRGPVSFFGCDWADDDVNIFIRAMQSFVQIAHHILETIFGTVKWTFFPKIDKAVMMTQERRETTAILLYL